MSKKSIPPETVVEFEDVDIPVTPKKSTKSYEPTEDAVLISGAVTYRCDRSTDDSPCDHAGMLSQSEVGLGPQVTVDDFHGLGPQHILGATQGMGIHQYR